MSRIEFLAQVHICFTYSKSSSTVVPLVKAQFFYPLFTNLLYWACWTWIYLSLRNSVQIQPLQLVLSVGKLVPQRVQRLNMVGLGPHQTEPAGSQRQDNLLNLKQEKDQNKHREGSVRTTYIGKSHSRVRSHISQKQGNNKALQQEINDLKRKLRRAQRKRSPSSLDTSDEGDDSYRQRSRTPPSETFSYEEEHHHKRSHKSLSYKGLVNNAISKALDWISKSPFTCKIEGAKLPRWFHQLAFTMYNGRTDPIEHVSQFNQRMTVHSKDEALMCKVFPSSLGPTTMRWFDGLRPNSIDSFKQLT